MQALRTPLERLVRELRWFGTATEVRALHVHTTATQRLSVLEHVAAEEHVPGNRSPFLVLEAPLTKPDGGFRARAEELVVEHASVREVAARAPTPVALPALTLDERENPFLTFVATLAALVEGLREPLEGVVLVLAPTAVEADVTRELCELIAQPSLTRVRWVFVDTTPNASLKAITTPFGELALAVDARVDPDEARAEMAARIAQMKSAPEGASTAQLVGGAGPRIAPPPRRNAASPQSHAASGASNAASSALAEVGLAALKRPETLRELQIALLEAATATSRGDLEVAIAAHGRAVSVAAEHGLVRERLLLELLRAGLLAQGAAFERAIEELARVRDAALAIDAGDLAVQAQLSLAACRLAQKDRAMAAAAYAEAGRLGASCQNVVLAVEGYRMAGQLLADDRKLDDAARCFQRALEVAEAGEPVDRALSTTQDAARTLAALCRQHGLVAQADALEAQADRLEAEALVLGKGLN